jgi:alpha-tubulin suppressor-like RCC1 family protein
VESLAKEKQVKSIFGDPNIVLGMLDQEGSISYATADATVKEKYKAVEQVAYCSSLNSIFALSKDGSIYQINIKDSLETNIFDSAPTVKKLCASNTHALFITDDPYTPIYGFGSNRFSQLGMDYHEEQEMTKLKAIEYFSGGLGGKATDIACGLFHSAVIIEDDLYTFGFNKDGRLGWGLDNDEDEDDIISLAQFLGENNQSVEVHAFKVVCGSSHTLVLDNRGNLWSCGSSKYLSL